MIWLNDVNLRVKERAMKPLLISIIAFLGLATFTAAFAIETPRIVPRINQVPRW